MVQRYLVSLMAAGLALGASDMSMAQDQAGFKVWVPSGKSNTAKEEANKRLVQDWMKGFWSDQEFDQWSKWMAPDFRNHDPREPAVGAQALVDWLRAQMAKHPERTPKKGASGSAHLFFIADGDLVAILSSPSTKNSYDVSQQLSGIAGNVIRIKDGKIAEWWFVGGGDPGVDTPPATTPPAGTTPAQ